MCTISCFINPIWSSDYWVHSECFRYLKLFLLESAEELVAARRRRPTLSSRGRSSLSFGPVTVWDLRLATRKLSRILNWVINSICLFSPYRLLKSYQYIGDTDTHAVDLCPGPLHLLGHFRLQKGSCSHSGASEIEHGSNWTALGITIIT